MRPVYPDGILMEDFKAGSEKASKEIYHRFYHRLYVYCYNNIRQLPAAQTEAEDILAECFIILFRKRADFDTFGAINNYLFLAVKSRCLDLIRNKKREEEGRKRLLNEIMEQSVEVESFYADFICTLRDAIDKLPAKQRAVILKLVYEEQPYKQVAESLQIKINSVEKLRERAIITIRKIMNANMEMEAFILCIAFFIKNY